MQVIPLLREKNKLFSLILISQKARNFAYGLVERYLIMYINFYK